MAAIELTLELNHNELSDDLRDMVREVIFLQSGTSHRLSNDIPLDNLRHGGAQLRSYLVEKWGVEEDSVIEDVLLDQGTDIDLLLYKIFQEYDMTDHKLEGVYISKGFW